MLGKIIVNKAANLKKVLETLKNEFGIILDFQDFEGLTTLKEAADLAISEVKNKVAFTEQFSSPKAVCAYLVLEAIKLHNEDANMSKAIHEIKGKKSVKKKKVSRSPLLNENSSLEIDRAELLLASKSIVDDLQSMVEKTSKLQVESLPAIVDRVKLEYGFATAENYNEISDFQLASVVAALQTARDEFDKLTLSLSNDAVDLQNMQNQIQTPAPEESEFVASDTEEVNISEPNEIPSERKRKDESISPVQRIAHVNLNSGPRSFVLHVKSGKDHIASYDVKADSADAAKKKLEKAIKLGKLHKVPSLDAFQDLKIELKETASAGATSAGAIAPLPTPLFKEPLRRLPRHEAMCEKCGSALKENHSCAPTKKKDKKLVKESVSSIKDDKINVLSYDFGEIYDFAELYQKNSAWYVDFYKLDENGKEIHNRYKFPSKEKAFSWLTKKDMTKFLGHKANPFLSAVAETTDTRIIMGGSETDIKQSFEKALHKSEIAGLPVSLYFNGRVVKVDAKLDNLDHLMKKYKNISPIVRENCSTDALRNKKKLSLKVLSVRDLDEARLNPETISKHKEMAKKFLSSIGYDDDKIKKIEDAQKDDLAAHAVCLGDIVGIETPHDPSEQDVGKVYGIEDHIVHVIFADGHKEPFMKWEVQPLMHEDVINFPVRKTSKKPIIKKSSPAQVLDFKKEDEWEKYYNGLISHLLTSFLIPHVEYGADGELDWDLVKNYINHRDTRLRDDLDIAGVDIDQFIKDVKFALGEYFSKRNAVSESTKKTIVVFIETNKNKKGKKTFTEAATAKKWIIENSHKFKTISLVENYTDDLNRVVKDALVSLKINGVDKIKTDQVIKDFESKGITIGVPELIDMLGNDPLVKNINMDQIEFSKEIPDLPTSNQSPSIQPEIDVVGDLSKKALKKRLKD